MKYATCEPIYNFKGEKVYDKIVSIINLDTLPKFVKISTITIMCKINVKFNKENIFQFYNFIKSNNTKYITRVNNNKFKNQLTAEILFYNGTKASIKFFEGGIHITGCRNGENLYDILHILYEHINRKVCVYQDNQIIHKYFINEENLNTSIKFDNFKIIMVNCGFDVGIKIDLTKLYINMMEKDINVSYEDCSHASVDVIFYYDKYKCSIFIFDSGKIIITGVNHIPIIKEAYSFIVQYLYENYEDIVLISIEDFFTVEQINAILENNMDFDCLT